MKRKKSFGKALLSYCFSHRLYIKDGHSLHNPDVILKLSVCAVVMLAFLNLTTQARVDLVEKLNAQV